MQRPLLLRMLPNRWKTSAWLRFYHPTRPRWEPLFRNAPLRFAPKITLDLVPGDLISDCIAFTGIWEYELSHRVLQLACEGGTLVEVGANLGYFSALWASANAANRVIAFETSPRVMALFQHNMMKNRLDSQVVWHAIAAGNQDGEWLFDPGPADQTGWGGFTRQPAPYVQTVPVRRLDTILDPDKSFALLIIDAEGADTWVLEGCEKLLRQKCVREIWYEQNRPRMEKLGIALDTAALFLRSLGYAATPQGDPRGEVVQWSAIPNA